jgi:collagenase-like PrtC family protease
MFRVPGGTEEVVELRLLNNLGIDAVIVRMSASRVPPASFRRCRFMSPPDDHHLARGVSLPRTGAKQVVVARELSCAIWRSSGQLPLEVFVHGALCVAYWGNV